MPRKVRYVVERNNIEEGSVTVQDAATYLGRSTEQVRRYLREGALVGYRVGQQWFIPREALEERMEERTDVRRRELLALADRVDKRREALRARLGELDIEALIDEAREGLP